MEVPEIDCAADDPAGVGVPAWSQDDHADLRGLALRCEPGNRNPPQEETTTIIVG
jgi:hypothetical protein